MTTTFFRTDNRRTVSVLNLPGSVLFIPQDSLAGEAVSKRRVKYRGGCEPWWGAQLLSNLVFACREFMSGSEKCTKAGAKVEQGVYGQRQEIELRSVEPLTLLLEFWVPSNVLGLQGKFLRWKWPGGVFSTAPRSSRLCLQSSVRIFAAKNCLKFPLHCCYNIMFSHPVLMFTKKNNYVNVTAWIFNIVSKILYRKSGSTCDALEGLVWSAVILYLLLLNTVVLNNSAYSKGLEDFCSYCLYCKIKKHFL